MSDFSSKTATSISDELRLRLPSNRVVTDGFDSSGNATITIDDGTPASREANVFIRVKARDWALQLNSIGLAQTVEVPTVIQMVTEANYAGTSDNIADNLTPAQLLPVLGTLLSRGTRLEWYTTADGTVPTVAGITGTPAAKFEANAVYGMKASS